MAHKKEEDKKSQIFLILAVIFIYIAFLKILGLSFFQTLDSSIGDSIPRIWSTNATSIMLFITNLGNYYVIPPLILALSFYLVYKKKYYLSLFSLLVFIFGTGLGEILKTLIAEERPSPKIILESGYSFPSLHSVAAIILFSLLIYIFTGDIKSKFRRTIFVFFCIIFTLVIGFSRIYLNVHWFTDVLAGFATGLFSFILLYLFFRFLKIKPER